MWIILDESLESFDLYSKAEFASGLNKIFLSMHHGEHAVASKSKVLRSIDALIDSRDARSAFASVKAKQPEFYAEAKRSKHKLFVVAEGLAIVKRSSFEWEISLEWIARNKVPTAALIAENLRDAKLYRKAANHWRIQHGLTRKVCVQLLNGGGADTNYTFLHEVEERDKLLLCITDSDKTYPKKPNCSTSKKCEAVASEASWIAEYRCLEQRETENILPINLINSSLENDGDTTKDAVEDLLKISGSEQKYWNYLDLKEGLPLSIAFGPPKGNECVAYWKPLLATSIFDKYSEAMCRAAGNCVASEKNQCRCRLTPGVGDKLLNKALDVLDKKSDHESHRMVVGSPNIDQWYSIGELVYSWGTAFSKTRS